MQTTVGKINLGPNAYLLPSGCESANKKLYLKLPARDLIIDMNMEGSHTGGKDMGAMCLNFVQRADVNDNGYGMLATVQLSFDGTQQHLPHKVLYQHTSAQFAKYLAYIRNGLIKSRTSVLHH